MAMTFEQIDAAAQKIFQEERGNWWHAIDECERNHYRLLATPQNAPETTNRIPKPPHV